MPVSKLMPPPSWIPGQPRPQQTAISTRNDQNRELTAEELKKLNTPLAAMLPPQLADKDVRDLFPEFRPGQVRDFFVNTQCDAYCNGKIPLPCLKIYQGMLNIYFN